MKLLEDNRERVRGGPVQQAAWPSTQSFISTEHRSRAPKSTHLTKYPGDQETLKGVPEDSFVLKPHRLWAAHTSKPLQLPTNCLPQPTENKPPPATEPQSASGRI